MRYIITILILATIGCTINGQHQEERAIDDDCLEVNSVGFNSPQEVVLQIVKFLQNGDTTLYLNTAIPLEYQKYLFEQNFEYRPDIEDQEKFIQKLESRFKERMNNFLIRAKYIKEIMIEDENFLIKEATIDTITFKKVRIKNYGGFDRFIVGDWADVTIKMTYNQQTFFLEIPQIIKVKEKWFLYYPEYYIRTVKSKEFVEKRVREINQKADAFWF